MPVQDIHMSRPYLALDSERSGDQDMKSVGIEVGVRHGREERVADEHPYLAIDRAPGVETRVVHDTYPFERKDQKVLQVRRLFALAAFAGVSAPFAFAGL